MKRKRREIVIELDEILVIRRRQPIGAHGCPACGEQVQMLTADEAALVVGISSRAIYRRAESGKIHLSETADGRLLICQNSLGQLLKNLANSDDQ